MGGLKQCDAVEEAFSVFASKRVTHAYPILWADKRTGTKRLGLPKSTIWHPSGFAVVRSPQRR